MPEDEKGHKQLGRAHALGHLAQMVLLLVLGVLAMREPWPTVGNGGQCSGPTASSMRWRQAPFSLVFQRPCVTIKLCHADCTA